MNEDKLQQKITELQALYNLENAIGSTLNLSQLLNLVMDMTTSIVKAEVGLILLYDEEAKKPLPKVTWGLNYNSIEQIMCKNEQSFIDWISKKTTAVIIKDLASDDRFLCPQAPSSGVLNSILCSPLRTKNNFIGIIILANKIAEKNVVTEFDANDLRIFNAFVTQISVAIENAELYDKVSNLKMYNENIINSIPSGVITTNLNGNLITFNKSAEFIFGITAEKVIGLPASVLFDKCKEKKFDIINSIRNSENLLNYEITLEKNPTEFVVLSISTSILKDAKNRVIGTVIAVEDLTEKKLLENQIKRAEQLSALGEMSAGIAHEIKNPLTSIRGFTQLLPKKINDKEFQKKYIDVVSTEVDRLNEIVERLLTFARPRISGFHACNLNDVLKHTISLLYYQISRAKIELNSNLTNIAEIYGDGQQLEQVFINIIINAIQAMEKGGKIDISTGTIIKKELDSKYREYAVVKIADTGKGITEEEIKKLFNPFYTTKEQGTGLGLSISNQIIEEHKGTIEVNSRLGKGTTFTICIPTLAELDIKP